MCDGCWEEEGRPDVWNERVATAVALLDDLYVLAPTGGPLHAEVDDWNVDHPVITPWEPWSDDDPEVNEQVWTIARQLAELLTAMPINERVSALAYHERFIPRPERVA
jgi:hypothetical protein